MARPLGDVFVLLAQLVELFLAVLLEIHHAVVGTARRPDQFIELEVHGLGVAVLRVLDQEHHQERDDRGARIDHELPRVAETKQRTGDGPRGDSQQRERKAQRSPGETRRRLRKAGERIGLHAARSGVDEAHRVCPAPRQRRCSCFVQRSKGTSPYRSCSSLPMISTSTNSPGFNPASKPFWICTRPSISGASAIERAIASSPSIASTRQRWIEPTLASSLAVEISACRSMKRARRSCFTSSGTGSGRSFAAAPSTGE